MDCLVVDGGRDSGHPPFYWGAGRGQNGEHNMNGISISTIYKLNEAIDLM